MSLEKLIKIYRDNGFEVNIVEEQIIFKFDELEVIISVDEEWLKSITSFFKAKQYSFDLDCKILTSYRSVEFQVVRLDPSFLPRPEYTFEDERGNKVIINGATHEFSLALLTSSAHEKILEMVKKRIRRRTENRHQRKVESIRFRFESLLFIPPTVRYEIPRKIKSETLVERGRSKIKACLFKLAYSNNECWELCEAIKSKGPSVTVSNNSLDTAIPMASYEDDLISYYKVARSSQFPNQAFLSYYHVLEYFFLRISDEEIFKKVKSHVNSLDFSCNYPLPEQFNDPFECKPHFSWPKSGNKASHIRRHLIKVARNEGYTRRSEKACVSKGMANPDSMQIAILEAAQKAYSELRICCLTKQKENLLFWSHYADSHKGYCVEFDTTKTPIIDAYKVLYDDDYPAVIYPLPSDVTGFKPALIKSKVWGYEEEFRILLFPEAEIQPKNDGKSIILTGNEIKNVYFGAKINPKYKEYILKLIDNGPFSPGLWDASLSKTSFKLEFDQFR